MKFQRTIFIYIFIMLSGILCGQTDNNVVIIIIDGARYSETFGHPELKYIPFMSEIANEGSIIEEFYNDSITYTAWAVPALWCGTWTELGDTLYNGYNTNYAKKPTLFEYFRKQTGSQLSNCFYILPYIENLWLPSFDSDYGPMYWPQFHSQGQTDEDVCNQAKSVMETSTPQLTWIYLGDVDDYGHSGNWNDYIDAIVTADSIVGEIWKLIQDHPFYANNTSMIVTNDHGRHDDQHGGFQNHGCDCEGCRHIMFLAAGPDIKKGFLSSQYRSIPDMAVTASEILGIIPEKATGNVISEIIDLSEIQDNKIDKEVEIINCYPNPVRGNAWISFRINKQLLIKVELMDNSGAFVKTIYKGLYTEENPTISFSGSGLQPGLHFLKLTVKNNYYFKKVLIIN